MVLTKKHLKQYQENMRVYISDELVKELLDTYGVIQIDGEGHFHDFTEQDIYEQLRTIIPSPKPITIKLDSEGKLCFE